MRSAHFVRRVLILSAFLTGSSSLWANTEESFELMSQSQIPREMPARVIDKNAVCTNFSGHWKGNCQFNGQQRSRDIVIQQAGCSIIILDGKKLFVGGSTNQSEQGPKGTVSPAASYVFQTATQYFWGVDRQVLQVLKTDSGNTLDDQISFRSHLAGLGFWKLTNPETLVTEFKSSGFVISNGKMSEIKLADLCEYSKEAGK